MFIQLYFRSVIKPVAALLTVFISYGLFAQSPQPQAQRKTESKPGVVDFIPVTVSLLTVAAIELSLESLGPHQPGWVSIPGIDRDVRSAVVWPNSSLKSGSTASDVLMVSLASSFAWAPFFDPQKNWNASLVLFESMTYTLLVTEIVKVSAARQRPYSAFSTRPSEGIDDNLSFFSGHTSLSFAAATALTMYFSDLQPENAWWIGTLSYLTAGAVGYLRMAGDKHYFTDVLTGAAVGTLIGYGTYVFRKSWLGFSLSTDGTGLNAQYKF